MKQASKNPSKKQPNKERWKQLTALGVIVFGLFAFLSIIFYQEEGNKLGIIGKIISCFFVNSTVGFAAIALPALMVVWGWVVLRKLDRRKPIILTNYTLIFILLFATAMGIANLVVGDVRNEWFGSIGGLSADVLVKLLGSIGSSIIVVTLMLVTLILAVDMDVHKSLERLENLWAEITGSFSKKSENEDEMDDDSSTSVEIRREDEIEEEGLEEDEEEAQPRETEIVVRPHEPVYQEAEEVEPPPKKQHQPKKVEREESEIEDAEANPLAPVENEDEEIEYVFPSPDLVDEVRGGEVIPEEELKANAELVRAHAEGVTPRGLFQRHDNRPAGCDLLEVFRQLCMIITRQ